MKENNTHEVIRGMFSLSSSTIIVIGTGLLTSVIIAREVSEEEVGTYFLILAIIGLLEIIGNLGMRISVVKFIAGSSSDDEKGHFVNNIVTLHLISVFIVGTVAWIAKPVLLLLFPSKILVNFYYFVPILFMVRLSENTFKNIMQGFQQYKRVAIIGVISGVINLFFVIVFVFLLKLGLRGLIFALLISLITGEIIRIFSLPVSVRFEFDPYTIKRILKFGLVLQGNDVLSYLINQIDTILVASMLNPISVSYIGIARKIPLSLKQIFTSISSVYFPHLTQLIGKGRLVDAEKFINTFLRLASAATLTLGFYAFLFQDEIILLVFGDKYNQSALGFGLTMIILMISSVNQILDIGYISAGRPGYVLIVNSTVALVGILGTLIMIPKYGFIGAVYARLLAELCGAPVSYWAVRKSNVNVHLISFLPQFLLMLICVICQYFPIKGVIISRIALALLFPVVLFSLPILRLADIKKLMVVLNSTRFEKRKRV